jgi:hypothetical protein
MADVTAEQAQRDLLHTKIRYLEVLAKFNSFHRGFMS